MSERVKKKPAVFFGWWTVIFTGIASGWGTGFSNYGISIFFTELSRDLGLNRATASWAPGISRAEGGIISPIVGWLADRFGSRWMVVSGILIAGTGLIFISRVTEPWQYYIAWGVMLGFGLNIGLTIAVDKTVNDWFIRRRGLAQGVKFGLLGLMSIVAVHVIKLLVNMGDWRFACLVWGIVMLACVPLAYLLVKPHRPEYYGLMPDGAKIDGVTDSAVIDGIERGKGYTLDSRETDFTFRQAIGTRTFWLCTIGFAVHSMISTGFNVHAYPFLTDIGIDEVTATTMLGMMIFFTTPARFFGSVFTDRVPKHRLNWLLAAAFMFQVIGIGSYFLFRSTASVYVLIACHGISSGAVTPLMLLVTGRFFGRKAFGVIFGSLVAILSPVGMVAPVFYGWIYDTTHNYDTAFLTSLIMASVAVITSSLVRPPREKRTAPYYQ